MSPDSEPRKVPRQVVILSLLFFVVLSVVWSLSLVPAVTQADSFRGFTLNIQLLPIALFAVEAAFFIFSARSRSGMLIVVSLVLMGLTAIGVIWTILDLLIFGWLT